MNREIPHDRYINITATTRLRYWQLGCDNPRTIILIPGFGGAVEYWQNNIHCLASHYQVLALDPLGFGQSDKPVIHYDLYTIAASIKAFMDALTIKSADIIGHSLGGAIAMQFTCHFPSYVDKLVLVSSAGFSRKVPWFFAVLTLPLIGEMMIAPNKKKLQTALKRSVFDPTSITTTLINKLYQITLLPGTTRVMLSILRTYATVFGMKEKHFIREFNKITTIYHKTLLIWGKQDRLIPITAAKTAAKQLPHAQVKCMDRCGHHPQLEHAQCFNQWLIDFLQ